MFRTTITRPFLRPPPGASLPTRRIFPPSPRSLPRTIATSSFRTGPSRPSIAVLFGFPRPHPSLRHAFSTFPRRPFNGGNQYRRFSPSREPLLTRLLNNARPHHFVIIGLGISGFYIYNTETVEVRLEISRAGHMSPNAPV